MHLNPDQLLDIQISALFVSDAQRRLQYIREPGYEESELEPAPRLFMGRTLHGSVWRFRHDLPDTVVQAVSICFCARITSLAAEAGVETVEAFRGHGYASAAVEGWAVVVRQRGLIPLYSTVWENVASQGVASKLGMVLYGDDWSIT